MASTSQASRAEVCVAACSDAWRGAGEVLAHAVGTVPTVGARLARLTHNPDLVLSDGEAFFMSEPPPEEGRNHAISTTAYAVPTASIVGSMGA